MDIQNQEELQPLINIGTIGHVAHGKSTLVKSISGIATQKFKAELERNITIKLGYSNAKIYKCKICINNRFFEIIAHLYINNILLL